MEWQPIETAPKDGTQVLLIRWVPDTRRHGWMDIDRWATKEEGRGWVGFGSFNPEFWPATHWMPLPAPPTTKPE